MARPVKLGELLRACAPVLLLIGAVVSVAGAAVWWSSSRQMQWTGVDAVIMKSGLAVRGSSTQRDHRWQLDLEYRYRIGDREYTARGYSSSTPPSSPARLGAEPSAELRELAARYPVGLRVQAYVSPKDPGNAMLVRPERPTYAVLVAGVVLFLMGWVIKQRPLRRGPGRDRLERKGRASQQAP
jgi:hypothetical protein